MCCQHKIKFKQIKIWIKSSGTKNSCSKEFENFMEIYPDKVLKVQELTPYLSKHAVGAT